MVDKKPKDNDLDNIIDETVKETEKKFFKKTVDNTINSLNNAYQYITNKESWKEIGRYLTDKQRLKAGGVLLGTVVGIAILKNKLPEITDWMQYKLPFLTEEYIRLAVDTVTNTILAPLGFHYSCKANNIEYSKKELLGQIAFAFGWGIARHYVYEGLEKFDEPINLKNASLKTGLYTAYYAFYGDLYAAFSEWLHKVCEGISSSEAIKGVGKNFKKKIKAIAKDPEIQTNLALNIWNMFNPWVESRPTLAGGLLVQYNMGVLKKSHDVKKGFLIYFFGKKDYYKKPKP